MKLDLEQFAQITRRFLVSTTDRICFSDFFRLCTALTTGYLRVLEQLGHRLPLDEYAGKSPRTDLAVDCLATLFAGAPGRPCYLIRDYLRGRIGDSTPPAEIVALLQGMIKKHTRQELSKMAADRDQQAANIRRAVRRVMENGVYEVTRVRDAAVWCLRETKDRRRSELPAVDDAMLRGWILESLRAHPQMPERCRAVFHSLDHDDRFANSIEQNRLIASFVAILTDHEEYAPSGLGGPRGDFVTRAAKECAERAAQETLAGVLSRLATERCFSGEQLAGYRLALDNLLGDLIWHGGHDPLPHYLREALPSIDSQSYLKTHKYVWETLVAECLQHLQQLLRERGIDPARDRDGFLRSRARD